MLIYTFVIYKHEYLAGVLHHFLFTFRIHISFCQISSRSSMFFLTLIFSVFCLTRGYDVKCRSDFDVIVSEDCKTMHRCVWGVPYKMPDCTPGLRFSRTYHVCVYENSKYNDCTATKKEIDPCKSSPCKHGGFCKAADDQKTFTCTCALEYDGPTCERALSKVEICEKHPYLRMSHPGECQLYYDCSQKYKKVPIYFEQHLRECPYPMLFDEKSLQCRNFTDVDCGDRTEHKSGCKYHTQQCGTSHCPPCGLYYPSCEGKDDGVWPHAFKPSSPFFMVCFQERFIRQGFCDADPILSVQSRLYKEECTSLYAIPKSEGGLLPECSGRQDGSYEDEQGSCDIYFQCNGGHASVHKCPAGSSFNQESGVCEEGRSKCH